jgi:DNA-binding MarR family transcriptional regulator
MPQILMLRKAHYFSLDNDLIDVHAKTIGATALAVYTALARYANRKTGECWPSIARLAHLLDLARNTVKTALRRLEAAGLIIIKRRRDAAGDATSHLYTLLDASPAAVEARLMQRRAALVSPDEGRSPADPPQPDEGRSITDLPSVTSCPPGRSIIDAEPKIPEPGRVNQADGAAGAGKDTLKAPTKRPCPHPLDERRHFGDLGLCTHCYAMIDIDDEAPIDDMQPGQEAQAADTRAA